MLICIIESKGLEIRIVIKIILRREDKRALS